MSPFTITVIVLVILFLLYLAVKYGVIAAVFEVIGDIICGVLD